MEWGHDMQMRRRYANEEVTDRSAGRRWHRWAPGFWHAGTAPRPPSTDSMPRQKDQESQQLIIR